VVRAVIWVTIGMQVEETSEKQISGSELRSRFSRDLCEVIQFRQNEYFQKMRQNETKNKVFGIN
jgi:hypothetical protein